MTFVLDPAAIRKECEARCKEIREVVTQFTELSGESIERLAKAVHRARHGQPDWRRELIDGVSGSTLDKARKAKKKWSEFSSLTKSFPAPIDETILEAVKQRGLSEETFNAAMRALEQGLADAAEWALDIRKGLSGSPRSRSTLLAVEVERAVHDLGMNRARRASLALTLMRAVPIEPLPSYDSVYQGMRNRELNKPPPR